MYHNLFQEMRGDGPLSSLFLFSTRKGNYSVIINDNIINEKVDDGIKDNSLQLTFPDTIVKK
jgi:hypothetical protein